MRGSMATRSGNPTTTFGDLCNGWLVATGSDNKQAKQLDKTEKKQEKKTTRRVIGTGSTKSAPSCLSNRRSRRLKHQKSGKPKGCRAQKGEIWGRRKQRLEDSREERERRTDLGFDQTQI
ncbi:hypothetical protein SLEP1_g18379 [Rubroshorea leprosula]|uniref:Uncharacterized protein n=1 Tax=Rubroshorea leprosula TaxID=152421 RepID=A0AAV5J6H3_9ROSI|nr:hypothetical protein SLEP1_g18379 [Rubroshorea leprosula]